ncbi:MAG: PEP-CTERM sorting domain-containing protein [Chthoniobacter sp.]|nr:PEP-CTERM sorting domain-containing protein [Chthoniobacter sp.]
MKLKPAFLFVSLGVLLIPTGPLFGQALNDVFDRDFTETYQGGFSSSNWIDGTAIRPSTLNPNAGGLFFATANDTDSEALGIGFTKNLGGSILNVPYTITMEVAYYGSDLTPILFSDFSVLRIGGTSGSVVWTSTPAPTTTDTWTEWTGTYTPAPADVGTNFEFQAVMDIHARRSLAIDGPVTATPLPEPSSALLLLGGVASWISVRRRRAGL